MKQTQNFGQAVIIADQAAFKESHLLSEITGHILEFTSWISN